MAAAGVGFAEVALSPPEPLGPLGPPLLLASWTQCPAPNRPLQLVADPTPSDQTASNGDKRHLPEVSYFDIYCI